MPFLNYSIHTGRLEESGCDSLIVLLDKDKPRAPEELDSMFEGLINKALKEEEFKGDIGEVVLLHPLKIFKRIIVSGAGEFSDPENARIALAHAINTLSKTRARKILLYTGNLPRESLSELIEQFIIISEMTMYDPGLFFKAKERKEPSLKELLIHDPNSILGEDIIDKALKIAESVNYARKLADTPSSDMDPERIEEEARKLAERLGLGIHVLYMEDLKKLGMNGIIGVGRGGRVPPRLIILEYRGRSSDGWDIAVIGKTVTFDAGGLNLKPTGYIETMKYDMCGGAAALGTIRALAELKAPVNVVAALPAVENMPGAQSYRPKDILKMYNGLTVEVNNTDAEGRLILADTLSYIEEKYKPGLIVDLATLTGAVVVALGKYAAGLFTPNDKLAEEFYDIGMRVGERVWRLPLWKEYYKQLKSDIADTSNIGGRPAGSITAAAFLSKFVEDKDRWVHIDIAGTAWVEKGHPDKPYYKNAATGYGVRLLVYYVLEKIVGKQ